LTAGLIVKMGVVLALAVATPKAPAARMPADRTITPMAIRKLRTPTMMLLL
jgi:hypothetical protein